MCDTHDLAPPVTVTTSSAAVSDPAVVATGGLTVSALEGADSGSQVVATFTDPGGSEPVANYGATIAWGDSQTSAGTITFSNGVYSVSGNHIYAEEGTPTVAVRTSMPTTLSVPKRDPAIRHKGRTGERSKCLLVPWIAARRRSSKRR